MKRNLVLFPVEEGCRILFPYHNIIKLEYGHKCCASTDLHVDDLILFAGGTDVNPDYYMEKRGKHTASPDIPRDEFEYSIFRTYPDNPKLGICRGAQFLNVMNGGKLVQHITGHDDSHMIYTMDGKQLPVTSVHHQMMIPSPRGKLLAWASGISDTYLNGDNKDYWGGRLGVDNFGKFMEPEVIWYPKTRSLCIQGHPEYLTPEHDFWKYSLELVNKYLEAKG